MSHKILMIALDVFLGYWLLGVIMMVQFDWADVLDAFIWLGIFLLCSIFWLPIRITELLRRTQNCTVRISTDE